MASILSILTKKEDKTSVLNASEDFIKEVKINVPSDSEWQKQLNMISLTLEDLAVIRSLKPLITENIEGIVDQFYKNIENVPGLLHIIQKHSSVNRLKVTLIKHIQEMFDGVINSEYVDQRRVIAHIHFKIGLQPKWYICSFQDMLLSILSILDKAIENKNDYQKSVKAVTKILNFEQQIVLEAFEFEQLKERKRHEEQKNKLRSLLETQLMSLRVYRRKPAPLCKNSHQKQMKWLLLQKLLLNHQKKFLKILLQVKTNLKIISR